MARSRSETRWDHTASIMAIIHNTNITDDSDAVSPLHYHPHHQDNAKVGGEMELNTDTLHGVLKPMVKSGEVSK